MWSTFFSTQVPDADVQILGGVRTYGGDVRGLGHFEGVEGEGSRGQRVILVDGEVNLQRESAGYISSLSCQRTPVVRRSVRGRDPDLPLRGSLEGFVGVTGKPGTRKGQCVVLDYRASTPSDTRDPLGTGTGTFPGRVSTAASVRTGNEPTGQERNLCRPSAR